MFFVALLSGFAAAVVAWFAASRLIAGLVLAVERRTSATTEAKSFKTGEVVLCGLAFLTAMALAFWVASLVSS